MAKVERGASVSDSVPISSRVENTLRLHKHECKRGVLEIWKSPISSFMTIAVLAIALALPVGLHVFLKNAQTLSAGWDKAAQISLFMQQDLTREALEDMRGQLLDLPGIDQIQIISSEQALDDFKLLSGYGDAIDHLDENPLPAVLVVTPADSHTSPEASAELVSILQALPEVESAQLDLEWVRRLYAIMQLAEKAVGALGMVLALSVLLIVGNTIRLSIQNRRDEIEVVKLVGATDAFIRRPFLYSGAWFGFFAGILCWLLVEFSIGWLQGPVSNLASLYQSQFRLNGMSFTEVLQLFSGAAFLGLFGSWISVSRHIRDIEPR